MRSFLGISLAVFLAISIASCDGKGSGGKTTGTGVDENAQVSDTVSGVVVGGACSRSEDCKTGLTCVDEKCQDTSGGTSTTGNVNVGGKCSKKEDCKTGLLCTNGKCSVDTKDTTPPTLSVSCPSNLVNGTDITVSFSANESSTFFCSLDGAAKPVSCSSPFAMSFSSDGQHKVAVFAKDEAGNSSPLKECSFTVDTIPPEFTIAGLPELYTNKTTAEISIQGADVIAYRFRLDDAELSAEKQPSEKISLQGLAEGNHKLRIIAKDNAGNWSPLETAQVYEWNVDTTPPVAKLRGGDPSFFYTNSTEYVLELDSEQSDKEGILKYTYKLDNGDLSAQIDANTQTPIKDLAEGKHSIEVLGIDRAGNVQTSPILVSWEIDITKPTATLIVTPPDQFINRNPEFEISGNGTVAYSYKLDKEEPQTVEATMFRRSWALPLAEGGHTFYVIAKDKAGNWQDWASATKHSFNIDSKPPTAVITKVPTRERTSAQFSISCNDVAIYRYAYNTDKDQLDNLGAYTPCSTVIYLKDLAPNQYYLRVVGRDKAGNWQTVPTETQWVILPQDFEFSLSASKRTINVGSFAGEQSFLKNFNLRLFTDYLLPVPMLLADKTVSAPLTMAQFKGEKEKVYDGLSYKVSMSSTYDDGSINPDGWISRYITVPFNWEIDQQIDVPDSVYRHISAVKTGNSIAVLFGKKEGGVFKPYVSFTGMNYLDNFLEKINDNECEGLYDWPTYQEFGNLSIVETTGYTVHAFYACKIGTQISWRHAHQNATDVWTTETVPINGSAQVVSAAAVGNTIYLTYSASKLGIFVTVYKDGKWSPYLKVSTEDNKSSCFGQSSIAANDKKISVAYGYMPGVCSLPSSNSIKVTSCDLSSDCANISNWNQRPVYEYLSPPDTNNTVAGQWNKIAFDSKGCSHLIYQADGYVYYNTDRKDDATCGDFGPYRSLFEGGYTCYNFANRENTYAYNGPAALFIDSNDAVHIAASCHKYPDRQLVYGLIYPKYGETAAISKAVRFGEGGSNNPGYVTGWPAINIADDGSIWACYARTDGPYGVHCQIDRVGYDTAGIE